MHWIFWRADRPLPRSTPSIFSYMKPKDMTLMFPSNRSSARHDNRCNNSRQHIYRGHIISFNRTLNYSSKYRSPTPPLDFPRRILWLTCAWHTHSANCAVGESPSSDFSRLVPVPQTEFIAVNQPDDFPREVVQFRLFGQQHLGIPLSYAEDRNILALLENKDQPLSAGTRAKESIRIQVRPFAAFGSMVG